ncbi:putative methyltransferase-domain-containing protein [Colletotrichum godetiae]|uniref:Methyltransferase-domain-containing protein n=1 Tax=Colletotrichum godetiae TaxID=1209918 RepID=A0AAJ0AKZ4_9PEZI|nr:putative methyltransferase-domain-containing protein [Colletotrichum godetiae]KAK1675155.1 putative methyltransferase-domain-containing protein [Colletotrichum godetiae]
MARTQSAAESVNRFCYQYLQLESTLEYPTAETIRESSAQDTIYKKLFSEEGPRYSPPARYRLRVLKELVARIESSIDDWDQHEVSEDLMTALSESLATPVPSEVSSAQQKSYVTYHLSGLELSPRPQQSPQPDITLLEARSLISASGTTGLRTWEAALHLGQFLCENPGLVQGKRVLELGAGTGYLAILCVKHLGSTHVVASDGSDDVINNLPESCFLNDLQESTLIRPMELRWGHALVGTEDQKWNNGENVDVVIGADITYDQSIIPALIATVEELFALFPAVQVLISATQRNEVTFEAFCNRCRQREMGLSYVDFPIPPREQQKGPFYNDSVPIRVCRVSAPPIARSMW